MGVVMKQVYQPPRKGGVDNGHKVFVAGNGDVLLADMSGDTPAQTDDGPLVVDVFRPARLMGSFSDHQPSVMIPVIVQRKGGKDGVVHTTVETALAVKKHVPGLQFEMDQSAQNMLSAVHSLMGDASAEAVAVPIGKLNTVIEAAQVHINQSASEIDDGECSETEIEDFNAKKAAIDEVETLVRDALRAKAPASKAAGMGL